jgi:hypothetical protein
MFAIILVMRLFARGCPRSMGSLLPGEPELL